MRHKQEEQHSSYLLFALGGLLVFLYEILITIILTEFFKMWVMYSYALALLSGLVLLYFYHSYITFSISHSSDNLLRFFLLYLCTYIIAWIIVLSATNFGLHYVSSIFIVSILLSVINYHANKKWVFVRE